MSLKIISVNIEGQNHLPAVISLLQTERPEVVCLQEVFKKYLPQLEQATGMKGCFVPMTVINRPNTVRLDPDGEWGIATLVVDPRAQWQHQYYVKHAATIPEYQDGQPNGVDRVVLTTQIVHQGQSYTILNTHFTWSPEGKVTALQQTNFTSLLPILKSYSEFVLCGDFNSARGSGGVFDQLASLYQDQVPVHYQTSIDGQLHRAGNLPYLVDGLFTTPTYQANSVRLVSGVSDHMAIVGKLAHR